MQTSPHTDWGAVFASRFLRLRGGSKVPSDSHKSRVAHERTKGSWGGAKVGTTPAPDGSLVTKHERRSPHSNGTEPQGRSVVMTSVEPPVRRSDTRAKMELVLASLWELPSNGRTVTGSLRDIQKLTGLGRGTVAAALKRMAEDGWINPTGNAKKSKDWGAANSFQLQRRPIAPPCFLLSRFGLGVTAFILWAATNDEQWLSTKDLAARANTSPRTARTYLVRLYAAGLVDRKSGTWIRIGTEYDIDAAERILVGRKKKIFVRHVLHQQVDWKLTTDRIRQWRSQGGHNDDC